MDGVGSRGVSLPFSLPHSLSLLDGRYIFETVVGRKFRIGMLNIWTRLSSNTFIPARSIYETRPFSKISIYSTW